MRASSRSSSTASANVRRSAARRQMKWYANFPCAAIYGRGTSAARALIYFSAGQKLRIAFPLQSVTLDPQCVLLYTLRWAVRSQARPGSALALRFGLTAMPFPSRTYDQESEYPSLPGRQMRKTQGRSFAHLANPRQDADIIDRHRSL